MQEHYPHASSLELDKELVERVFEAAGSTRRMKAPDLYAEGSKFTSRHVAPAPIEPESSVELDLSDFTPVPVDTLLEPEELPPIDGM